MHFLVILSLVMLILLTQTTTSRGQLLPNTSGQKQTAEQCQTQCQSLYKFYKTFIQSPIILTRFLDSCLQVCPVSNSVVTTTTVRTTTSTSRPNPIFTTSLECGISGSRERIVGGTKANECELPWVVEVVSPCVNCGGTIVDKRHIVTAAHCLSSLATGCRVTAADVTVRVGSSSLMNTTAYKVSNIEIDSRFNYETKESFSAISKLFHGLGATYSKSAHQMTYNFWCASTLVTLNATYSKSAHQMTYNFWCASTLVTLNRDCLDFDLAVLTLSQDLTISQCVRPICLPMESEDPAKADECLVAGWGKTFEMSMDRVHINDLMKAKVPIVDLNACKISYQGYTVTINDYKLCAGNYTYGGVDSCKGDSGGPLMCYQTGRYYFYGIVSFGLGCALPRYPGVYTRVNQPDVYTFIKATTQIVN